MKTTKKPQNVYFKEIQKQNQAWIYSLISILFLLSIYAIIQQNLLGIPFGNNLLSDTYLWFMPIIPLILILFMRLNTLETLINNEGVWLRYKPYHNKYRFYSWDSIKNAYVRLYQPLKEYGGYGIRFKGKKSSGAYNVSGKTGLQLILENNRKILIGTGKGREISEVINKNFNQKKSL